MTKPLTLAHGRASFFANSASWSIRRAKVQLCLWTCFDCCGPILQMTNWARCLTRCLLHMRICRRPLLAREHWLLDGSAPEGKLFDGYQHIESGALALYESIQPAANSFELCLCCCTIRLSLGAPASFLRSRATGRHSACASQLAGEP